MKILYVFLILLMIIGMVSCGKSNNKGIISQKIRERQEQLAQDPDNARLQKSYVIDTIFEIQQQDNPNGELLSDLNTVSATYLLTHDDDDMTFAHAQVMILFARNYSADRRLIKASRSLAKGFQLFDSLYEKRKDDILYRAYRGRYYSSVPKMFGKQDIVVEDANFITTFVLDPNNDAWLTTKDEDAVTQRVVIGLTLENIEKMFDNKGLDTTDLKKAQAKLNLAKSNATHQ